MSTSFDRNFRRFIAATVLLGWSMWVHAGTFSTDFNSGKPNGTAIYGNTTISTNDGTGGGVNNSGCLKLTTEAINQAGGFIITNDLDGGRAVASFTASFKVLVGRLGNGGEGFSFNFATNLPAGTISEEGTGTGLTVEFDTHADAAPDTGPSIDVKVGGTEVSSNSFPGLRTGMLVDAVIQLNPNGTLDVIYDGVYAVSNANVSALGQIAGGRFGLGARTSSTTDNHFIDDLSIVTRTNAGPFVQSFAPRGRKALSYSPIDIVLTDATTQVDTNTIVLQLDGVTVFPIITRDGSGNTFVHYASLTFFAPLSTHAVNLTFSDNASPTPQSSALQYSFSVGPTYTTLFREDFEQRNLGVLDMNADNEANSSTNGDLSGNPWFGPVPPNCQVVGAENSVTPHNGTNMIRGTEPNHFDQDWFNLAYRLNGQTPYQGNVLLDWWFYDPLGVGGTSYREFMAIAYYSLAPTNTDYPGTGSLGSSDQIQRISLGAAPDQAPGFDGNKYQARVLEATDGYDMGWFNTTRTRSTGWHHGRIIIGPALSNSAPNVDFYIDDLLSPVFTHNAVDVFAGFNVLEITAAYGGTLGYFDQISFAVATPPSLAATRSGSQVVLSWPGPGFTLQASMNVDGPYTNIAGATSPYSYDSSSSSRQFFRLRN